MENQNILTIKFNTLDDLNSMTQKTLHLKSQNGMEF